MRDWWRQHSLGTVLVAVFLGFTATAFLTGHHVYVEDQAAHHQPADWAGFWWWISFEYSMSLVADVFGACLLVLGSKWWREVGSAESD